MTNKVINIITCEIILKYIILTDLIIYWYTIFTSYQEGLSSNCKEQSNFQHFLYFYLYRLIIAEP